MERVADYIIRKVNEAGAGHIFLITGRGILYLTDAVARNRNIEGISTYHEQGASYAAMAYAAAGGSCAACLVSTGCAAANAVAACLCAYQDNLPVVFISGNHILEETTGYTGIPIRTYGSQETDIIKIVASVTKYAVMLTDISRVTYEVEKALYEACHGRKGPVWIDVPLDVQNMRMEEAAQEHYEGTDVNRWISHDDMEYLTDHFRSAERPVLLIGGGVRAAHAEKEAGQTAERLGLPVCFSPTAADVYGTDHELSVGAVGSLGGTRAGNFAVQNADFILAVGTRLCSQETGVRSAFAREAQIAAVDIDEMEHTKSGVHIDRMIVADAKIFLRELLKAEMPAAPSAWAEKCRRWKDIFSLSNEEFIKELRQKDELDLYAFSDMLSDFLPDEATVITDAGFEELIVPSAVRYRDGQKCLFPAAQGAMGYAIPAILGAHFAGRKNIVCIVGDGSFMMNMQELGIIAAHHIPVKIFVINNNMYSVIRKRQKDLFRKRTIGNDPSDGVPAPVFRRIAESAGFQYKKVGSLSEFHEKAGKMLIMDGEQYLYEILCTPDQKYLHESYAVNERGKLVRRPIEDMAPFLDREIIRREMVVKRVD